MCLTNCWVGRIKKMRNYEYKTTDTVILPILINYQPKTVVEYGAGTGTITKALLQNTGCFIITYEPLPYFQEMLKENLRGFENRYELITDYRILPKERNVDLLVVDGGEGADGGGVNRNVYALIYYLNDVKTIFVDGNRKMQNTFIEKALRERFVYRTIKIPGSSENYRTGMLYECVKTSSKIRRLFNI